MVKRHQWNRLLDFAVVQIQRMISLGSRRNLWSAIQTVWPGQHVCSTLGKNNILVLSYAASPWTLALILGSAIWEINLTLDMISGSNIQFELSSPGDQPRVKSLASKVVIYPLITPARHGQTHTCWLQLCLSLRFCLSFSMSLPFSVFVAGNLFVRLSAQGKEWATGRLVRRWAFHQ